MGKHKHKRAKKKNKKQKRKSQASSSSEDEWVEKKVHTSCSSSDDEYVKKKVDSSSSSNKQEMLKYKRKYSSSDSEDDKTSKDKNDSLTKTFSNSNVSERDEWMGLPTSFSFVSNSDRKQKREEEKHLERQKQQYNPRECSRELNPYWKDGGDGLPEFKKPDDSYHEYTENHSRQPYKGKVTSNWKKKKSGETHTLTLHESSLEQNREQVKTEGIDEEVALSEKELNVLAAKLVKAEIMGNTKLVEELKDKLQNARNCYKDNHLKGNLQEEQTLLTHTNTQGHSKPVKPISDYGESSKHHRKKNVETHSGGHRVRYFADDDKYSLKQMFENEKYESADNQNKEFMKMAQKIRKNDDLDDIFADNIRKKESDDKTDQKNRTQAINESERISKSLDNCKKCIQSAFMLKHLMVSMAETNYLALPEYEPLTKGHCFIIPIRHVPCATQLDENEWAEILDIRKSLTKLFKSKGEDVIFFETAMSLHRFPHMYIECVPLPEENGDLAPIYFKKAIDESESEWAQNKKLISLKGRDVRKAIPKGLPYFAVSFGIDNGFAHVIEDEQLFPSNFAQEIIGGMLDLHHSIWRKPKSQKFEEQSKRVLEFSKEWKAFEHTV